MDHLLSKEMGRSNHDLLFPAASNDRETNLKIPWQSYPGRVRRKRIGSTTMFVSDFTKNIFQAFVNFSKNWPSQQASLMLFSISKYIFIHHFSLIHQPKKFQPQFSSLFSCLLITTSQLKHCWLKYA